MSSLTCSLHSMIGSATPKHCTDRTQAVCTCQNVENRTHKTTQKRNEWSYVYAYEQYQFNEVKMLALWSNRSIIFMFPLCTQRAWEMECISAVVVLYSFELIKQRSGKENQWKVRILTFNIMKYRNSKESIMRYTCLLVSLLWKFNEHMFGIDERTIKDVRTNDKCTTWNDKTDVRLLGCYIFFIALVYVANTWLSNQSNSRSHLKTLSFVFAFVRTKSRVPVFFCNWFIFGFEWIANMSNVEKSHQLCDVLECTVRGIYWCLEIVRC